MFVYVYVFYLQSFSFSPEDLYLDNLKTNQNVLWKFEGLQMLLGTDLPIFNSGNNSYQSLRLRYNIYFKFTILLYIELMITLILYC